MGGVTLYLLGRRFPPSFVSHSTAFVPRGTRITASSARVRVATDDNATVRYVGDGETYELNMDAWVVSTDVTYHPQLVDIVATYKTIDKSLNFDYVCFKIDMITLSLLSQSLQTLDTPQSPLAKSWLSKVEDSRWVDSVLNDWIDGYA